MPANKNIEFSLLEIRIDWSEMDVFGHVNNVMFMKYIQAARVNFWESVGIGGAPDSAGLGANLASAKCDFLKPLFYPGTVKIETDVAFIKNSSFGLQHVLKNSVGETVANGQDVVVLYNYAEQKKQEISDELRRKLTLYLVLST